MFTDNISFIASFGHLMTVYSYNIIQMFLHNGLKDGFVNFNVTKCKVLHIGNSTVHCSHQYTLQEVTVEILDDMCDQGIIIDSKLKFHAQSDSVIHKANSTLGLIYKVFECKDTNIILNLYKSLVRTQLEYSNAIWGPHYITDKQKVEAIQRRATQMISTCSELPYTDRLQYLTYHCFSIEDAEVICCF